VADVGAIAVVEVEGFVAVTNEGGLGGGHLSGGGVDELGHRGNHQGVESLDVGAGKGDVLGTVASLAATLAVGLAVGVDEGVADFSGGHVGVFADSGQPICVVPTIAGLGFFRSHEVVGHTVDLVADFDVGHQTGIKAENVEGLTSGGLEGGKNGAGQVFGLHIAALVIPGKAAEDDLVVVVGEEARTVVPDTQHGVLGGVFLSSPAYEFGENGGVTGVDFVVGGNHFRSSDLFGNDVAAGIVLDLVDAGIAVAGSVVEDDDVDVVRVQTGFHLVDVLETGRVQVVFGGHMNQNGPLRTSAVFSGELGFALKGNTGIGSITTTNKAENQSAGGK
jgi:hypothetical protein